jgi:hypothetical protein
MTAKSQTYSTRHLTARDHQLIDALEGDPRYRRIANILRPPVAKPVPKAAQEKAQESPQPKPAPEVAKPTPKAPPAPAPGHPVGGMTSKDFPGKGKGD